MNDLEPRPRPMAIRARGRGRDSMFLVLLDAWRVPLLVALCLAALATALLWKTGTPAAPRPAPPIASGRPAADGASVSRASGVAPAASASPSPQPTSTPSNLRQLVAPTMTPLADNPAVAPARKPGTPDPDPATNRFIVVDGDSGSVLFQRNAYEAIAPASLTKIMTAILGIERGNLSDHVKVDVDATTLGDSTVMGLEPWFDVTLEDILYGLMLPSGNDAALAIGRYVAGADDDFVRLMNQKAAWLGLSNTHFANPHGLDDPNHYSCPADMVAMARYAMQYPEFRKLAKARGYDIQESNISYTIYNLNPILGNYPGADGVKIGYTDNAGRSMVATAVRNGHRVYVAFMQSQAGLLPDTSLLLDWAFNSFTWP